MPRELLPVSVYLPPVVIAEATKRAEKMSVAVGTLLRGIIIGQLPPVKY